MVSIWIDGASKNNGKPDCVSAGGAFIMIDNRYVGTDTVHEFNSTSQRGELNALLNALRACHKYMAVGETDFRIVTDSEYIYNTITKAWYINWQIKGWITAAGEPVKNRDIWEEVAKLLVDLDDLSMFHIKGHVISIGKVTASNLLKDDPHASCLYQRLCEIYKNAKPEKIQEAKQLFIKNHGYEVPDESTLKDLIVGNMVADCVATEYIADVAYNYYAKT